jgi:hypothetical protein
MAQYKVSQSEIVVGKRLQVWEEETVVDAKSSKEAEEKVRERARKQGTHNPIITSRPHDPTADNVVTAIAVPLLLMGVGFKALRAGYNELKKSPEQRKQEREEKKERKKIEQEQREERRLWVAKQRRIEAEIEAKEREQEQKEYLENQKVEVFNVKKSLLPLNIYLSRFLWSFLISLASLPFYFACFKHPNPIVFLVFVLVPYSLFRGIRPAILARGIKTEQELECMEKSVSIGYHFLVVLAIYVVVFFGCGAIWAKYNLNDQPNSLAAIGIRIIMISSYLSGIYIFLLGIHKKPSLTL